MLTVETEKRLTQKLLPDQLKELWQLVEEKRVTEEEFHIEQERLLLEYRNTWRQALILNGHQDLEKSLLSELGRYLGCGDLAEIKLRCESAASVVEADWQTKVDPSDRESVERHYDENADRMCVHMSWHSLSEDNSPLGYVTALRFAQQHRCCSYLDFGSGVGSGGLLFARHGLAVTLADIASPLLEFSQWRFGIRGLPAQFVDLKTSRLPNEAFDLVTAMDVFEHLFDPVGTLEELWRALKPGGLLFGRFDADSDDQAGHIVHDFGPTFERMKQLGFVEVWEDEWLWGQQVFQKP